MNGENRSAVSEILWERAHNIMNQTNGFNEEEIEKMHLNFKSLLNSEEILNRAKVILKSYSDQEQASKGITK